MKVLELAQMLGIAEDKLMAIIRESGVAVSQPDDDLDNQTVSRLVEQMDRIAAQATPEGASPAEAVNPTIEQLAISLGITPGQLLTELKRWGIDIQQLQEIAEQVSDLLINNLGVIEKAVRGYRMSGPERQEQEQQMHALKQALEKAFAAKTHKRINPNLREIAESLEMELDRLIVEAKKYGITVEDPEAELSEEMGNALLDKLDIIKTDVLRQKKAEEKLKTEEEQQRRAQAAAAAANAAPPVEQPVVVEPAPQPEEEPPADQSLSPLPPPEIEIPVAAGAESIAAPVEELIAVESTGSGKAGSARAAGAEWRQYWPWAVSAFLGVLLVFSAATIVVLSKRAPAGIGAGRVAVPDMLRTDRQQMNLIWSMQEQGFFQSAAQLCAEFKQDFPQSEFLEEVYFKTGDILFRWNQAPAGKQYQDALAAFQEALHLYPKSAQRPWGLLMAGRCQANLKMSEAAVETYRQLLQEYPGYEQRDAVMLELGNAYVQMRRHEQAHLVYSGLLAAFPSSPYRAEAAFQKAVCLERMEKYSEAVASYKEFLHDFPRHIRKAEARYAIGGIYFSRGDYERARAQFAKTIARYPHDGYNARAQFMIAQCYARQKNFSQVRQALQEVIYNYYDEELAKDSMFLLGDYYREEQNVPAAIAAYEDALEKYPQHRLAYPAMLALARLFIESGHYPQAEATVQAAIKRFPNAAGNDHAQILIAQTQMRRKDYLHAAQSAQTALEQYPASPLREEASFILADAFYQAELFEKANQEYVRILTNFPQSAQLDLAHYRLAEGNYRLKRYAEAASFAQRGIELYPLSDQRYRSRLVMARAYLSAGDRPRAVEQLERLSENEYLKDQPVYYEACLLLARTFIAEAAPEKALKPLDRIIAQRLSSPLFLEAVKLKINLLRAGKDWRAAVAAAERAIEVLLADTGLSEDEIAVRRAQAAELEAIGGDIYFEQRDFKSALIRYLRAQETVRAGAQAAWLLYQVANAYQQIGEREKSAIFYERLKKEHPEDFWAQQVEWNLKRMEWQLKITMDGAAR
ncbi:MAG: tetratricopeptide repeat protein [Candidatus Omnitrophica bacterium]|nr:tetratricopeptide repeat protein [Candidatus Omnitrophota bacterium]